MVFHYEIYCRTFVFAKVFYVTAQYVDNKLN
jgi:hypothetical protein